MILNYLQTKGLSFLENIVISIVILVVGFWVVKYLCKFIFKALEKAKIEPTLISFLNSLLDISLKVLVVFTALNKLGFPTSSLVAILGTVGAALALGFKDNLSSFVSGVIIIINHPFKVGDYVDVAGQSGTIKEIKIMDTILATPDNKIITIPNNTMSTSTIVNYSTADTRRVDIVFSVDYSTDIELAKNLIMKTILNHDKTLKEPEPFVRVTEYAANSIDITARIWCNNVDYWDLKFDLLERVKAEFDKNNISIPFNQLDVHLDNRH